MAGSGLMAMIGCKIITGWPPTIFDEGFFDKKEPGEQPPSVQPVEQPPSVQPVEQPPNLEQVNKLPVAHEEEDPHSCKEIYMRYMQGMQHGYKSEKVDSEYLKKICGIEV